MKVDEDFLRLIGYYLAEGSNHRAYIRFSIADDEKRFAKDIVRVVKKVFDLDAQIFRKHNDKKTGTEITVCNSILANVFENLCGKGAQNKHIPFAFQQLPINKQLILLKSIYRGDGFQRKLKGIAKNPRRYITTISRTLSEQLVDILLRSGFYPSRYTHKEKIDKLGVNHKKAFTIGWCINPKASKFHHLYRSENEDLYWILPILEAKTQSFSGKVYNLTIDQDHSYVANNFAVANCGEAGDVYSFLEQYEGMEFAESLKYLADRAGVKLKAFKGSQTSEKERIIEVNAQAIRFYSYLLLSHEVGKRALDYLLKERGLKRSTIEEFGLGYSPENPEYIKKFLINKKKFSPEILEKAGITFSRGSNLYDRFSGRIIFPLLDHRGNPIGFSGRVLPWDKRETGKYINSPETPAYHKSSVLYALNITRPFIKKKGVAIIVEGELDAISSYQAGIKNIVAIKGSALTEEQVRLLSRFAPKFILALDTDLAGDAAARRGIMVASNAGVEVKVAEMAGAKDPDEAARGDLDGYKSSLINSVSIWDFFIDSSIKRYDVETGVGKGKISKEVIPVISGIEDKIVQAHYVGVISQKLGIPEDAVREQIQKFTKDPTGIEEKVEEPKIKDRRDLLEERFLSLAFQSDPKVILTRGFLSLISEPRNLRIVEEYKKNFSTKKTFDLFKFSKSLPPELFDGFTQLVLREAWEEEPDPDKIKKELDLVGKELKILSVKEKLVSLTVRIKILEEKGDKKELFQAQEKFNKLASLLSKVGSDTESGVIFD